jgi:hypothetical protein
MDLVVALLATAALLGAAGYAQYRIPFHTAGRPSVRLTRGVLATLGLAVGFVMAASHPDPALQPLLFLAGFGAVHLPAAAILFVKRARGAGRS